MCIDSLSVCLSVMCIDSLSVCHVYSELWLFVEVVEFVEVVDRCCCGC